MMKRGLAAAMSIGAAAIIGGSAPVAHVLPGSPERETMLRMAGETAPPCVPTFIYYEDGTYIIVFCHPTRPPKLPFG